MSSTVTITERALIRANTSICSPSGGAEYVLRELDAGNDEFLGELRPDARGMEIPDYPTLAVDAALLKAVDVLHRHHLTLHAGYLRDGDDLACPVRHAGDLDYHLEGGDHLLADGAEREVEAGHQDHVLDAGEGVPRRVGVDGGEGALMAGVHRLHHVEGLGAAHLAHQDAVGAHTQAVPDEVSLGYLALPLQAGRPRLQADDVGLLQAELGGVLG